MAIIMNEFLPVPNIAPSSYILLCNNLSLQIYDTFIMLGRGMPTSAKFMISNRSTIWVMVIYIQV